MKKMLSVFAATVLLVGAMGLPAFAHGGHGNGHRAYSQTRSARDYDVCTVKGCVEPGLHEHDGEYYYCQNHGGGHGCGRGHARR